DVAANAFTGAPATIINRLSSLQPVSQLLHWSHPLPPLRNFSPLARLSSNFFFGSGVPLDSSGAPICPSLFLTVNTADNCLTFDPSACDGGGSSGGSGSGDGAVATRSVGMSSGGDSGAIWSAASDTSSGSGDGAVATRSIGVSSGSSSSSSTASIAAAEASPDSTTAGDLAVSSPHVLAHLASHEGKESAAFLGHTEREAFLGHSERMAMLGDRVERKGEQATSEAHVVLEGTEPRSRAHLASHEDNQRAAFLGHTERAAMLGDRGKWDRELSNSEAGVSLEGTESLSRAHVASHEDKERAPFVGLTERVAMLGDRGKRKGEQAASEAHVSLEGTEPLSRTHLASHESGERDTFLGHTEIEAFLGHTERVAMLRRERQQGGQRVTAEAVQESSSPPHVRAHLASLEAGERESFLGHTERVAMLGRERQQRKQQVTAEVVQESSPSHVLAPLASHEAGDRAAFSGHTERVAMLGRERQQGKQQVTPEAAQESFPPHVRAHLASHAEEEDTRALLGHEERMAMLMHAGNGEDHNEAPFKEAPFKEALSGLEEVMGRMGVMRHGGRRIQHARMGLERMGLERVGRRGIAGGGVRKTGGGRWINHSMGGDLLGPLHKGNRRGNSRDNSRDNGRRRREEWVGRKRRGGRSVWGMSVGEGSDEAEAAQEEGGAEEEEAGKGDGTYESTAEAGRWKGDGTYEPTAEAGRWKGDGTYEQSAEPLEHARRLAVIAAGRIRKKKPQKQPLPPPRPQAPPPSPPPPPPPSPPPAVTVQSVIQPQRTAAQCQSFCGTSFSQTGGALSNAQCGFGAGTCLASVAYSGEKPVKGGRAGAGGQKQQQQVPVVFGCSCSSSRYFVSADRMSCIEKGNGVARAAKGNGVACAVSLLTCVHFNSHVAMTLFGLTQQSCRVAMIFHPAALLSHL
ncbi:hypothetical protein CLOP_g8952, partial [Closterium sp. NIES-67]